MFEATNAERVDGRGPNEGGVPNELARIYHDAAAKFRDTRRPAAEQYTPLLATAAILALLVWSDGLTLADLPLVLAVLVLFELGPLLASQTAGFPNTQSLVPFLRQSAAPAAGEPWKFGLSLLLAPLPVVFMSLAGAFAGHLLEAPHLLHGALIAASMCLVALLPFASLKGGTLLRLLVFSRWPRVERAFVIVTGAAMALLGWQFGQSVFAVFGALTALGALGLRSTLNEAEKLRDAHPSLSARPDMLREAEVDALFMAAHRTLPLTTRQRARRGEGANPEAPYVTRMRTLHQRVVIAPPRVASSLLLLGLYLGSCLLCVVAVALSAG